MRTTLCSRQVPFFVALLLFCWLGQIMQLPTSQDYILAFQAIGKLVQLLRDAFIPAHHAMLKVSALWVLYFFVTAARMPEVCGCPPA